MRTYELLGEIEVDAAGVDAVVVGQGSDLTISSTDPTGLVAELVRLRAAVGPVYHHGPGEQACGRELGAYH